MSKTEHQANHVGTKLGVLLICIGALLAGIRMMSATSTAKKPVITAAKFDGTAEECLQEMVKKYRATKAYADHGRLTLSFTRGGRRSEQAWDASVQFVRPGRLRVQAYQLLVVSDAAAEEKRFFARLEDAETNNIDNQVVMHAAPESISLNDLVTDRVLADQLGSRLQRPPVQLELLMGEKALAALFTSDFTLSFLNPAEIHGVGCQRIEAKSAGGSFVFWIDADQLLLHKLEYPASALLPELVQDPFVSDGRLVAEFTNATFAPKVSQLDFSYTPPAAAHFVKSFVPPPTTSNVDMLGKSIADFEFVSPAGRKLNRDSIAGKIMVLFWYAHHPLCEKPAQTFAELAAKYRDNTDIQFLAVCTETADVGDKQLLDQLKSWNVNCDVVRDLKEYRTQTFFVRDLPSVVLLDAAGKYQSLLVGSEGITALPTALERLQRGDDLAAEAKIRVRQIRDEYEKMLAAGGTTSSGTSQSSTIAAISQPESLQLTPAWKLEELGDVRGVLSVPGDAGRLLAIVNDREVWEFNSRGEITHKFKLDLPKDAAITSLRSITVRDKTYYAAFKPFANSVHIFDDQLKLLMSYPRAGTEPAPISDVQFAASAENEEPTLLIAFADSVGVHAVSLTGKLLWKNRAYLPLVSVNQSLADPDRGRMTLLTGRGTIGRVNQYGNEDPELKVPGWSVLQLHVSHFANPKQAAYAVIARHPNDDPYLIGLNREFEEQWNYPLPAAPFTEPVDFVTSGVLRQDSSGEWIIAWADGSVHIISEDGTFSDNFNSGVAIRGIAVLNTPTQTQLVIATAHGVTAWHIAEKRKFDPQLPELK